MLNTNLYIIAKIERKYGRLWVRKFKHILRQEIGVFLGGSAQHVPGDYRACGWCTFRPAPTKMNQKIGPAWECPQLGRAQLSYTSPTEHTYMRTKPVLLENIRRFKPHFGNCVLWYYYVYVRSGLQLFVILFCPQVALSFSHQANKGKLRSWNADLKLHMTLI